MPRGPPSPGRTRQTCSPRFAQKNCVTTVSVQEVPQMCAASSSISSSQARSPQSQCRDYPLHHPLDSCLWLTSTATTQGQTKSYENPWQLVSCGEIKVINSQIVTLLLKLPAVCRGRQAITTCCGTTVSAFSSRLDRLSATARRFGASASIGPTLTYQRIDFRNRNPHDYEFNTPRPVWLSIARRPSRR